MSDVNNEFRQVCCIFPQNFLEFKTQIEKISTSSVFFEANSSPIQEKIEINLSNLQRKPSYLKVRCYTIVV